MEEIIQRVFAILLAVFIFFILPLYIAFEKRDDIAYTLALKITNDFVDNVNSKGYLTLDMYEKFLSDLSTTDNVYDISIEYTAKKYEPVIQIVGIKPGETEYSIIKTYDYLYKKQEYEEYVKYGNDDILTSLGTINNSKVELTYRLSEVKYGTNQILGFLSNVPNRFISLDSYYSTNFNNLPTFPRLYGLKDEGVLLMNKGDQFNVIIKNKNTTFATVLFNTLTFGANAGNDVKVYINYGGTVKNEEYKPAILGDVNEDGKVDDFDKKKIEEYHTSNIDITLRQKIAADINGDGIINSIDQNLIGTLYT